MIHIEREKSSRSITLQGSIEKSPILYRNIGKKHNFA